MKKGYYCSFHRQLQIRILWSIRILKAIELVYYRDMRQTEAAEMMNVSLAALESVLRRARQKLHSELAKYRVQLEMI